VRQFKMLYLRHYVNVFALLALYSIRTSYTPLNI
jgi:hypothetical protein